MNNNLNIKTEFFGLNQKDVYRYILTVSNKYKTEIENLQNQIRNLLKIKTNLLEKLQKIKNDNQEVVYETEKKSSASDIKIKKIELKKVEKTILLLEAIADQRIDDMVHKARKQMLQYDEQLEALEIATEETRGKIEKLLKKVIELLNMDSDEKPSKVKVIELSKHRANTADTPVEDEEVEEVEEDKEMPVEVENSLRNKIQKYSEIKSVFALRLQEIMTSDDPSKQNGAVLLLQINDFIIANYLIKCSTGDTVLDAITNYIKSSKSDAYIQRLSYDNIGIIIFGMSDVYRVSQFVRSVQAFIQNGIYVDGKKIELSSNVGIAKYPNDSTDKDIIINYAGIALYKAREHGKNTYQFIDEDLIEKIEFVNELKEDFVAAIKNEEIVLHYQPQISLKNKEVFGFEALLRWKNDKYNKVAIFELIDIAEKENIISEIGFQLFKKACIFARDFEKVYHKKTVVSINISAMQLNAEDFVKKIEDIINETDVSPFYLGVEITESCLISNFETASIKLQRLKDMGFTIFIDDFGTGYSNLSYLLNLPISAIKIDKNFINQLQNGSKTEDFIKLLIDISHKLGWDVVAEGVETKEQFEALKSFDCDCLQGYYFSKPVPEQEAIKFISQFNANDI